MHHADLRAGYSAGDWPSDFVSMLMARRRKELERDGFALRWRATDTKDSWATGEGPEVTGKAADLLWWLLGRGSGDGLTCSDGELPELERWA